MKLPDFLQSPALNQLRTRMGAVRLGELTLKSSPNRLTLAELESLVTGGIDVGSLDEVRVLSDGSLAYKDRRVLLYIRDVSVFGGRQTRQDRNPRYHVSNCSTLQEMRASNRIERYVVAARDDGQFQVNFIRERSSVESSIIALRICQNCLSQLGWQGFGYHLARPAREQIVGAFTPRMFFEAYPRDLVFDADLEDEDTAPLNGYTEDFPEIANSIKRSLDYRCEQCHLDLSSYQLRRHLHVHHKNGQKFNNARSNLIALCLRCHANQPGHGHMRNTADYRQFLEAVGGGTS